MNNESTADDQSLWRKYDSRIERIRKEYGVTGELLFLEDLAKVMGVPVKSVWNYRARGTLPKIPCLNFGGRDAYWIVHIAAWLSNDPIDTLLAIPFFEDPLGLDVKKADQKMNPKKDIPIDTPKRRTGDERSIAKDRLLKRGLQILAEREQIRKKS